MINYQEKNQIKKRSMGTICNRVLAQNGRLQISHIVPEIFSYLV